MTDLVAAAKIIKDLQRRPDLKDEDYRFMNVILKLMHTINFQPLLEDKIETYSVIEEMLVRVKCLWLQYQDSNVIPMRHCGAYEDDEKAVQADREVA